MVRRDSFISGNILSFLLLKDFKFLFMVLEIDVLKIPLNFLLKVNFLLNFLPKVEAVFHVCLFLTHLI